MSVNVVLNGVTYTIPDPGDTAWGQSLMDYFVAQATGLLQKAGGTFTLTAEVDFGATYGLKSTYFKSRTSNIATLGQLRLAHADSIQWRNNANDGNLKLEVNSSDELVYDNGVISQPIQGQITVSDTSTIDLTLLADDLSADIVTGSIGNSLINASAGIALTKLAAVTASRALVSDGSGFITAATTTATEIGYVNGVTSAIQTQLDGKQASGNYITDLTGDIVASGPGSASATYNGTVPLNKGGTGQTTKSAAFDALSPMSASGDIIYGGASGTGTRLAKGSDGQVLTLASGVPSWANAGAPTAPLLTKYTSGSGTHTLTGSPLYIRVRMVGGGGGGGGSGSGSPGTGGTGGTSTFGTTLLSATGGSGGVPDGGSGGAGGSGSLGSGPVGTALNGADGGGINRSGTSRITGGTGGMNPFGGAGSAGATTGGAGVANTGAGGGGAGAGANNVSVGCGGGAGGFVDAIITSPSSSYSYAVGAAGTAGTAGTSGSAGGAGGSGYIEVTEYYQ